jgi:uncharacterized protein YbjQ (UPF0145 family)
MIVTTTDGIEGKEITDYLGIVSGECVYGANFVRDFFASIRDVVGGRSGSYENVLNDAKKEALADLIAAAQDLGADAVVGLDLDYETVGDSMLMVSANGTAVKLR